MSSYKPHHSLSSSTLLSSSSPLTVKQYSQPSTASKAQLELGQDSQHPHLTTESEPRTRWGKAAKNDDTPSRAQQDASEPHHKITAERVSKRKVNPTTRTIEVKWPSSKHLGTGLVDTNRGLLAMGDR